MRSKNLFLSIFFITLFCLATIPASLFAATESGSDKNQDKKLRALPLETRVWTGDFDEMLKRRVLRFVIPHSRTLYFIDKGHERGMTLAMAREFEIFLNKKYKKILKKRPLTVYVVPMTRDRLMEFVVNGHADIAAGNLTITDKRSHDVDFIPIPTETINEILLTGADAPEIKSETDLSGKSVHVRLSSSYYESLLALNERLVAKGLPPAILLPVPEALEDEDMMEMLNAGILQICVVDNWKAELWAPLLTKITLREDIVLRAGSRIGMAVRKDSTLLQRELADFLGKYKSRQAILNHQKALLKKFKITRNNSSQSEIQKFNQIIDFFKKYGQQYRFDPLLLAAQGYQESRLEQNARSRLGAIGIMQLMPKTGAAMKVGNIRVTEPNIHAGAKYLDMLLDRYFSDASFSEIDRSLFAFAAYNAGPGNISKARKKADAKGFDPNVWFNNVEVVVGETIGSETTSYVRNVFKYYVSYRLLKERQDEQDKARKQLEEKK